MVICLFFFVMKRYDIIRHDMMWCAYLYFVHLLAHHESCGTEKHITSHIRTRNSIFCQNQGFQLSSNGAEGEVFLIIIGITKVLNGMFEKTNNKNYLWGKLRKVKKKIVRWECVFPASSKQEIYMQDWNKWMLAVLCKMIRYSALDRSE